MTDHKPWLDWKKLGYTSHEALIEEKAGQSLPKTTAFRRQLAVDKLVDGPWEKHDWPLPEVPDWSEEDSSDPADQ